jgi:hypothetical protein
LAHDVFISHSSINKKAADAVCHTLEHNGVKCWIAPRDIPPGANYGGEIIKGIKNCKVFLLIFSKEANASSAVAKEVERAALGYKKTVIPFRIDDGEMNENLEFFLTDVHWLDAYPDDTVFSNLVTAVKNALGMPAEANGSYVTPTQSYVPKPPDTRSPGEAGITTQEPAKPPPPGRVTFRDKTFERIVRAELQVNQDELLDEELLSTVTSIRAAGDAVGVQFKTYTSIMKSISTGNGLLKVQKGNLRLLSDIQHLPNLTELIIPFQSIADISRLSSTRIKKLDLSDNSIADLSPTSGMDYLEEINLEHIVTDSFLPVVYAKSIKKICIYGQYRQNHLDELCKVGSKSLTELTFSNALVETIEEIGNFPNLEFINLAKSQVPDLSPLRALTRLKRASLSNDVCTDFSFLKELPVIENVIVSPMQKDHVLKLYDGEPPFRLVAF